jgi:serine/threonine protein kinase
MLFPCRGKFAVTKYCTHKISGDKFAAKCIKYDSDSIKFAVRELDFMRELDMSHPGLVKLHEAYIVRKYLILIMDAADGMTLLDFVGKRHTLNEDVIAGYVKSLCEVLAYMHERNAVHLDLRPTNIRFNSSNVLKLVDYNSARFVANKKAGAVVDVIGDTEFCAPEMLRFEPVLPGSDMWSVAILTYIMLSGISPFFYEDEDEVLCLTAVFSTSGQLYFTPSEVGQALGNLILGSSGCGLKSTSVFPIT